MYLFDKALKPNHLKSCYFHVLCHNICNFDCTTPNKSTYDFTERKSWIISPRWEWKVVSRFFLFVCQMSHENARMLPLTTDPWWLFSGYLGQWTFFLNLEWPFSGLKFENLENEISVCVRNWELKTWVLKSRFENPDSRLLSKKVITNWEKRSKPWFDCWAL